MPGPLSPDEMQKYANMFGLTAPAPAVLPNTPAAASMPLAAGLQLPPSVRQQIDPPTRVDPEMPLAAGLHLPPSVAPTGPAMPPPPRLELKPGQEVDTRPDVPFAPTPKGALDGGGALRMPQIGEQIAPQSQPAYPPIRSVPAQWQNATRITEGVHHVPEEAKQLQNLGMRQQQSAVKVNEGAERTQGQREAGAIGGMVDAFNDQMAAQQQRQANRDFQMEQARVRYDMAVDKAAKMADVNPGAIWSGAGGGAAAALATIGVVLGQWGASMTGGQNEALKIIENTVDRSLQAQRDNLAKARGDAGEAKGVLAEMRANFGDERQAELAAKDALLLHTDMKLRQFAADAKDEQAKARALDLSGQINQRRGQLQQGWAALEEGNVKLQEKFIPAHTVGGMPTGKPGDSNLFVATGPDGQGYYAKVEKEAIAGRALQEARLNIIPMLQRLKELRAKTNFAERGAKGVWSTEEVDRMKSLQNQVDLKLKNLDQSGAMDKGMQELAGAIRGDWTAMQGHPEAAADEFARATDRAIEAHERAQGAQGARQVIGQDAAGNPVATTLGQKSMASPRANVPPGFQGVAGAQPLGPHYQSPQKAAFDPNVVVKEIEKRKGGKKKGGGKSLELKDPTVGGKK